MAAATELDNNNSHLVVLEEDEAVGAAAPSEDQDDCDWVSVTDKLAEAAAELLVKSYVLPASSEDSKTKLIIDRYLQTFTTTALSRDSFDNSSGHIKPSTLTNTNGNYSEDSDTEASSPAPLKHRPFFRRFSFRGITKAKALNIFNKQGSSQFHRR